MTNTKKFWIGWGVALAAAASLLAAASTPPFIPEAYRLFVMQAFHTVCHQLPDRSPHLAGVQLAVCHRCFGIYGGMLAGVLLFPGVWKVADAALSRWAGFVLLAAIAVPGIDWLGDIVGLWANSAVSRFATGAVFGLAAGYYLARALARLSPAPAEPAQAGMSV